MNTSTRARAGVRAGLSACLVIANLASSAGASTDPLVDRGRYLARVAGCNDCHTAGYAASGGTTPEGEWLLGDRLGWRGAWGTTYPSNLRRFMHGLSEEQWLTIARTTRFRPPMPWFALRDMDDTDLRALHRYITHLGPAGDPAPSYVPPEQVPTGPYVQFPGAAQ